ncbi:MAG TPA: transcriptional regulator NrdR [Dehalococcoidia bacterium]|nr:transcriptional regulator NrdR [Dehalococcoidia bacterium]
MKCPFCGHDDTRVTDSREADDGIRRRRECLSPSCGRRFTTYERVQVAPLTVVKKDGRREEFSREKVLAGIHRSCAKLPVSAAEINAIAEDIETTLHASGVQEVPSYEIGDMVMERLRELNHVAYVRFASHYKNFLSLEELQAEFERLASTPRRPVRRAGAAQPPLLPAAELSRVQDAAPGKQEAGARKRESGRAAPTSSARANATPEAGQAIVPVSLPERRRRAGGRR